MKTMKKIGQCALLKNQKILATSLMIALTFAPTAHGASLTELFGGKSTTESGFSNEKPLPVHEAFAVFPEQKGDKLTLRFEVKDGYYLYQNKIKLALPEGVSNSPLQFNLTPNTVNDPDFGLVPVFEKNFTATTTLSSDKPFTTPDSLIKWQGCAKAGLCYPPEKTAFTLTNFSSATKDSKTDKADKATPEKDTTKTITISAVSATTSISVVEKTAEKTHENPLVDSATTISTMPSTVSASSITAVTLPDSTVASNTETTITPSVSQVATRTPTPNLDLNQDNDPFGLVAHPTWAMVLLFLAGLGLAFTPCVLPMLPIVANIIARQHKPTAKKGLLLTSSYGLGVATSYGMLGAIIAVFGQSLGIMNWLQNPVILLSFAGLFVLLGLYMLDKLPIRLPAKLSHQLNKLTQVGENRLGSVTGSFITGFFSALVVSPCVSAPLAGALAGVATTGNPVIGFFALFMLGLGLSTPLILLGATQGNFMPKSGAWMNWVKTGFALLLFAVALLMVERVFATSWMLGLWAIWFAVVAVWAWQWQQGGKMLTKALSLVFAVWSACLVIGMASGATDSWQPLKPLLSVKNSKNSGQNAPNSAQRITTLAQLNPIVASNQKILVDVTADWCIECRIMDKNLFANPPSKLQNWQVVKLDVTEDTPESRAIYQQLKVFGPPVLLYFDKGKLVYRQNGEVKRDEFEQALNQLL